MKLFTTVCSIVLGAICLIQCEVIENNNELTIDYDCQNNNPCLLESDLKPLDDDSVIYYSNKDSSKFFLCLRGYITCTEFKCYEGTFPNVRPKVCDDSTYDDSIIRSKRGFFKKLKKFGKKVFHNPVVKTILLNKAIAAVASG